MTMNLVYNSQHYSVVEYDGIGGYELIDKLSRTSAFMLGDEALKFRTSMQAIIADSPNVESVDAFLDDFEPALERELTFH
jgi:hypothetical protein